MQKIFLTESIHPDGVARLKERFEVVQGSSLDPLIIAQEAKDCVGMLIRSAKITATLMDQLPSLKVIAKHGMGVDNIDVNRATQKGILVVNAPFSNLNAVAEHIVMLLLALSKRTVQMDGLMRAGKFEMRNFYQTTELKGSTVGVIGMGKIARMVVKKLENFELNLIAHDPFVQQRDVNKLAVRMTTAEEVYRMSDFVIVHTALTPATHHLVGAEQFRQMKSTARIINASRGAILDEQALIEALRAGTIAGAGLDVFEQEPPDQNNPLFSMEQVIVSPHNAALSDGALRAMALDSARGIIEYLNGEPVSYSVNPEVWKKTASKERQV